ncbi:MAG: hypothetical protein IJM92_13215 [Fibrobacter sp.]|uniref:hypothetical protein n=1 Tax=Fibrobacter sp. TaxID=35828 RepID=UPI0025C47256|nr:hypothetical protein [Fibrobacter sp.]MBQ7080585.1 hypothetical protein [Fibrobacter sp.]
MAKKTLPKKMDINTSNMDSFGWKTDEPAGFQSLKSALIAYFGTYYSTLSCHPILPLVALKKWRKFEVEEYKTLYFTAITHFQHFFEFILKDKLRGINPILETKFDQKGFKNVYQALKGRSSSLDSAEMVSIEFSDALARLLEIRKIDPDNATIKEINFLLDKADILKTLTTLRNRIWHKGLFFLRYHELDLFVGQHILPLIKEIMALPDYANQRWKYKCLACEKDPIDEIIRVCKLKRPSFQKIALLKELGRASYCNPLVVYPKIKDDYKEKNIQDLLHRPIVPNSTWAPYVNRDKIDECNARVEGICKSNYCYDVYECPVCGLKTMIKNEPIDWVESVDEDDREERICIKIPKHLHCETCSFHIEGNVKDLSLIGIKDKKFWEEHEL